MKRITLGIAFGALLLGVAAPAFAQNESQGRINQRKENQQRRIGEGVENGSLTPRETARLERKEGALNREIRHDRVDGGGLSPTERRKIERQQDHLSRDIARQKHDRQHR